MPERKPSEIKTITHQSPAQPSVNDQWDYHDPFRCISCDLQFDPSLHRNPYLLPCQHSVCLHCLKQCIEQDRKFYECPICENCIIRKIDEVKPNAELLSKMAKQKDPQPVDDYIQDDESNNRANLAPKRIN